MFIKPFKTKSNVQLKSSDRKKLQSKVIERYALTDEQLSLLFTSKATISQIKIITHSEQIVTVYACDKKPLFFECPESGFLPTIYSLWLVPTMVPFFTTHPAVLPRLANGADLMLPGKTSSGSQNTQPFFFICTLKLYLGVIKFGQGVRSYGYHKKDEIVAVNLTSNKAAVAIGRLARSSEDLYMSAGQGICVKVFHVFGDKLWAMESSVCSQIPFHGAGIGNAPTESDFPALGSGPAPPQKNVQLIGKPTNEQSKSTIANLINKTLDEDFPALGITPKRVTPLSVQAQAKEQQQQTEQITEDVPTTVQEIGETPTDVIDNCVDVLADTDETAPVISEDDLLKNAFFTALKRDGKTLALPLLTSTFYRCHVIPAADRSIELKRTSYKKLSKFLNEMMENRFITVKEEQKGIEKIVAVNIEHPDLLQFIPKVLARDQQASNAVADTDKQPASLFVSEMTELYLVTDDTAPLFAHFSIGNGDGIETAQVKKLLKEYVCQNKLQSPLNSRTIHLNALLGKLCDTIVDDKAVCKTISFDELLSVVMTKMTHSYEMRSKNEIKTAGGKKATIQMTLATRSGNKKVTLVNGLEGFGIRIAEFEKACRVGVAASTAITKVPHQKGDQLLVQGNQIRFIHKLLTDTYKIPTKNIFGLDLAKKEKKSKK